MTQRKFVSDEAVATAPKLPFDRPCTKAEVWAYVQHVYTDVKSQAEMIAYARGCWIEGYIRWVNFHGWKMPPDWTPDLPVPPKHLCPSKPFETGAWSKQEVIRLHSVFVEWLKSQRRAA